MRINVIAKPNSKEEKIEKLDEESFRVYVKEPPREGKANAAILHALSHYFSISKSQISIISGQTSKNKDEENQ